MNVTELLQQVKTDSISLEEAEEKLKYLPYESLGDFAKIDHHRGLRSGFPETIYCAGKTTEHLIKIYESFSKNKQDVLGTRSSEAQYEAVKQVVPQVEYDAVSHILKIHQSPLPQMGQIAICTGGTSDLSVAEEAAQVAEYFGSKVLRIYDVGVAGIHRLLAQLPTLEKVTAIIAVAGMEGALPGVLAGLVSCPVIAVPTSVGYGAHFNGLSPLLTMLNSCAEGITVVNIDNGFGAGYSATQINRLTMMNPPCFD